MNMNLIDKAVGFFNPSAGLRRAINRQRLETFQSGYSHHGASRLKKKFFGWMSRSSSPDDDITDNIDLLRERCRDLYIGSPLSSGALKTLRSNIVGTGIRPKAKLDAEYLGISQEAAERWEKEAEREFELFAKNCDVRRKMDFYELQALAILSACMSGEVFATLPMVRRKNDVYALKINLIEADRVCNPYNVTESLRLRAGIEDDTYGCPVAYHIAKVHPKDRLRGVVEWEKVPAFGAKSGRRNVLHVMESERPGQRRGVPLLSPVIDELKQITRFSQAEIDSAVMSALLSVVITSERPEDALAESIPGELQVDRTDPNSLELGTGNFIGLKDGEKIQVVNTGHPNTNFDAFVMATFRQIGTGLDIPMEVLMKNFTASYSASRAALLEFWKSIKMRRGWFVAQFCQPIYEELIAEAVARGRLKAPGFFTDPALRAMWCAAEWYGMAQGQIDPKKEAEAASIRIRENISTRAKEAAEISGGDFEYIVKQRSKEERMIREGGITVENKVLDISPDDEPDDDGADGPKRDE